MSCDIITTCLLFQFYFIVCFRARAEAQDPPNNEDINYENYNGEYGSNYDQGLYGDYGNN